MRCTSLGIIVALTFSPAFAQVSSESFFQNTTGDMFALHHGPIRDNVDHGNGTSTSTNWSGYAVLGSSFVWAKGSWIVPTANCSGVGRTQYAAFWVGLDGYSSATVEQTGTDSDCDGTTPSYYAWYEFYPKASVTISSLPIKPGDAISALIYFDSAIDKFVAQITDETTGKTFETAAAVSGAARSSAEWITEAPCCTFLGGILPLSDFGTVSFGKDKTGITVTNWAMDESTTAAIGGFPAVNVIEINKTGSNSSPQTSDCSALSTDNTSFTCTWAQ
jgi:Peptidase A4 family